MPSQRGNVLYECMLSGLLLGDWLYIVDGQGLLSKQVLEQLDVLIRLHHLIVYLGRFHQIPP